MAIRESDKFLEQTLFSKAFENIEGFIQLTSVAVEGKLGLISNITEI